MAAVDRASKTGRDPFMELLMEPFNSQILPILQFVKLKVAIPQQTGRVSHIPDHHGAVIPQGLSQFGVRHLLLPFVGIV